MRRRQFMATAAAIGVQCAWSKDPVATSSTVAWREDREAFPQGVASGDPDQHSVILWTRRPLKGNPTASLRLEVARDANFTQLVVTKQVRIAGGSDWTCRVLVGGLQPSSEYFYRFTDAEGKGSRIGRTLTAPAPGDDRPVRFTFVSCQNINYGAQNAWRRMIFDDERAPRDKRLDFVLHLGDFIYELVWYPEETASMYDRKIREIVRYAHGEKVDDFHIPTDTDDYRAIHRAYLSDIDIQDARARWPFVAMWDNHEFSWKGWQGVEQFDGKNRPAQSRKVAANQAWFEYHPGRLRQPKGTLQEFDAPTVKDLPVEHFDAQGLGQEPNNLRAIDSLEGFRNLKFGANVDLIITDQHSYRSQDPLGRPEAAALSRPEFPDFVPEEAQRIVDAGRAWNGGKPPTTIKVGDKEIPNYARNDPPQTVLGARQKVWFKEQLKSSKATWKIWANTAATLDMRADPQNLPAGLTIPWDGGFAGFGGGDPSSAYSERAEVYDWVEQQGIGGFVTVAGDRHSFWAGFASASLPPAQFKPVGVAFVTGSLSAPGMVEASEYRFPKDHPLRPLFLADRAGGKSEPTMNLTLKHGVKSALEYARSGDLSKAKGLTNPDNAPHLAFVDMGGHGFAVVTAGPGYLESEFVCIPRPIERSAGMDGGPLRYRVVHRANLWRAGETPSLKTHVVEGDPGLSA